MTGLEKQVNSQWAIDLIAKVPPIEVNTRIVSSTAFITSSLQSSHMTCPPISASQVACDGGGGPLGHPKVYINLEDGETHVCIYCGLRYIFKPFLAKDKEEETAKN